MREEIIIKDYLKNWLKPSDGRSLKVNQLDNFLKIFQDDGKRQLFTDGEKEDLKKILFFQGHEDITIAFSTGYPQGDKEQVKLACIYVTEAGWQQGQQGGNYLGSHSREGKASTQITVTGIKQGNNIDFIHPSLMIRLITALLITGEGDFTNSRMLNQTISETPLPMDEQVSYKEGFLIPIRSLLFSYESRRTGVNTDRNGF